MIIHPASVCTWCPQFKAFVIHFPEIKSSMYSLSWGGRGVGRDSPVCSEGRRWGNWLLLPYADHQPILFLVFFISSALRGVWYLKFLSLFGPAWPQICLLHFYFLQWFLVSVFLLQYVCNHVIILLTFRNINILKSIIVFCIFFVFVNFYLFPLYYCFFRVLRWSGSMHWVCHV